MVQNPIVGPIIIEILSRTQFEKELKTSKMPLVVDFYAPWCSPCKRIAPKLESTAQALAGKVKFLKVNVDMMNELTANYQISSMPTVLYFDKEGMIRDRKIGEPEIGRVAPTAQRLGLDSFGCAWRGKQPFQRISEFIADPAVQIFFAFLKNPILAGSKR